MPHPACLVRALTLAAGAFAAGCAGVSRDRPPEDVNSYFDVLQRYSTALDKRLGGDLSKVVPAVGGSYPIGTPIRAGTTSPITSECQPASANDILKTGFSALPVSKAEKVFTANAQMPATVRRALADTVDLGIKFESSSKLELGFSDLRQEVLTEDGLGRLVSSPRCRSLLEGKRVTVVRGYVYGKVKLTSGDVLDIDPTAKFAKIGDYSVRHTNRGSFEVSDTVERPQFMVIAEYTFESAAASQRTAPSKASVDALTFLPADRLFK